MYGPCAEIAVALRDLVPPHKTEKLVKDKFDFAIAFTDLKGFVNVKGPEIGATFNGLYLLFIWLFMSINDYTKAPTSGLDGEKPCTP